MREISLYSLSIAVKFGGLDGIIDTELSNIRILTSSLAGLRLYEISW